MQNHGFLASINGIVSGAQLFRVPLLMLISDRGAIRRARPVADRRRRGHRVGAGGAAHSDHAARRPGAGAASASAQAQTLALLVEQAGGAAADARSDVGGSVTRIDALRAIYDRLDDCAVVTIMGAVAAELQSIGHRPNFFYLQHAMGLASSVGLGHRPEQARRAGRGLRRRRVGADEPRGPEHARRYRPANLLHVVFDNESLLSVGGFPTATGTVHAPRRRRRRGGRAAHRVRESTLDDFVKAFDAAQAGARADHARGQGRGHRARRRSSPTSACSRIAFSSSATCRARYEMPCRP